METSWAIVRPESRSLALSAAMSASPTSSWSTAGTGSCHSWGSGTHGPEQERADRTHVAVQQLVPGLGEGQRELVGVLQEAARDLLVRRVDAQRQVGREHRRPVLLRRVVGVRDDLLGVLGDPLLGAAGARGELPLVAEEDLEEAVAPLGRPVGPGDLEAAGDRVGALAAAVGAQPAQALRLQRGALGLRDRRGRRRRRRRGSCRRCGRRRSARRSPRRSSPSGRRSRG